MTSRLKNSPVDQLAQDARDRLAEQTALLLVQVAQTLELGQSYHIGKISDAIDDLRHFTGRDGTGRRE